MCTLAAYVGVTPDVPLLVAANRDEYLDRPSAEPAVIAYDPWVVGGQDLTAGGTWFGLNEHGVVAGLLNRRGADGPDPSRRSRGLLCLETLQARSAAAAVDRLRMIEADDFNGFNLLVADVSAAYVATNLAGAMHITPLPRGVHLLTNLTLNDATCPRIAKSSGLFQAVAIPPADRIADVVPALQAILSDHTTALDPRAPTIDMLCVHLPGYGTRSSSIVALLRAAQPRYWHAPGPPCRTAYRAIALPRGDRADA